MLPILPIIAKRVVLNYLLKFVFKKIKEGVIDDNKDNTTINKNSK